MESIDENKVETSVTPPYLSVAKLDKLFGILSSRNIIQVTQDYFFTQGFSKADAYLAVGTLRFFGLVDDSGKTNESLRSFQLVGNQKKKKIEEIVRSSYALLFQIFASNAPYKSSKDDLINEFITQYKISKRIADPAVRAFLWFCERAGLREPSIKVQERKPKMKKFNNSPYNEMAIKAAKREEMTALSGTGIRQSGIPLELGGGIYLFVPIIKPDVSEMIALGELGKSVKVVVDLYLKEQERKVENIVE